MDRQWLFQVRVTLSDQAAEEARRNSGAAALKPLTDVLHRHDAKLTCQYDAFAGYVAEAEARGTGAYPLYKWTKATIEDPAKKVKYLKAFALHVDSREVYAEDKADALEADLKPLVGGPLVLRVTRHDTNPANNPQPPPQHRP